MILRLHDNCTQCETGTYSDTESLNREERIELRIGRLVSAFCTACGHHQYVANDKDTPIAPTPRRACAICGGKGCFKCTGRRG